jgi:ATP-dependent DNA helicase DinG
VEFAHAVDAAMASGGHLLAEAPTGTGKSIAYIVPAVRHALLAEGRAELTDNQQAAAGARARGRSVIVTANIALQEQLVKKDLPLLSKILPQSFRFALLKGRNNYLCLDRLTNGSPGKPRIEDEHERDQIVEWSKTTESGDKSELSFEPKLDVWKRFSVSSDECPGDACEFYSECYAEKAKKDARAAHIVVTNYNYFYRSVFDPTPHGFTILDEGHKMVEIARDVFGFRITAGGIKWIGSGELLDRERDDYFARLLAHKKSGNYKSRLRLVNEVPSDALCAQLDDIARSYAYKIVEKENDLPNLEDAERRRKMKEIRLLERKVERACVIMTQLEAASRVVSPPPAPWRPHPDAPGWYWDGASEVKSEVDLVRVENVFFIEEDGESAVLLSKPISVAEILREKLFVPGSSVTVTSATMTAAGTFDHLVRDAGVVSPSTLVAQSPFDWTRQALLVVPHDIREPDLSEEFAIDVAEKCAKTIELARGRTLCLFTSNKNMNRTHVRLRECGYRVLRQGEMPRAQLIDEFRRDIHSVLLGVASFWAGVDVQGESLSCVVIDRLPFTPPGDPVMDAIKERDERGFFKHHVLPRAIVEFKQGFGRLIRSVNDRGVVVVLDRRVRDKYGGVFLRSVPDGVRVSSRIEDVKNFLDGDPLVGVPAPPMLGRSWL